MIRQRVIEKGVPLPPDSERWPSKYAIKYLEVGDSFVHIDRDVKSNRHFWNKTNGLLYSYAKRYGFKIKVRKVATYSVRVWRVE